MVRNSYPRYGRTRITSTVLFCFLKLQYQVVEVVLANSIDESDARPYVLYSRSTGTKFKNFRFTDLDLTKFKIDLRRAGGRARYEY